VWNLIIDPVPSPSRLARSSLALAVHDERADQRLTRSEPQRSEKGARGVSGRMGKDVVR